MIRRERSPQRPLLTDLAARWSRSRAQFRRAGRRWSASGRGAPGRGAAGHRAGVIAVVALVVMVAACGGDGGGDDEVGSTTSTEAAAPTTTAPATTTTTVAVTTTTTEPRSVEEEVEEAFWRAEAVLDDLLQAPNPDDGRLAETRVEPSLSHVASLLSDLKERGVRGELAGDELPPREVLSVSVDGSMATVTACRIDNMVIVDEESGETIRDQVSSAVVEVVLRRNAELWKVSESQNTSEWSDGLGCDR